MYRTAGTPRRGVLFGLLAAVVAMVVMVPTAALAYTAKYSSAAPKSGSSSRVTTPTISVTVYAPAGVKGSTNYSLYVDGVKVKPSISYSSKYRKFKLSYRRTTPLKVGRHKATVKIKDVRRHTSSYTWSFTVLAPLPPPPPPTDMKVTIESNACLKCHVGYPATHPMSSCGSCHSATGPVPGEVYGPADQSAHTLACSLESPCHGGGGSFPHVLGTDCMSCHDGRYPTIPPFHGGFDPEAHISNQTFCAGPTCHDSSLTVEHFRHTVDGARLTCETCHASTDPKVVAGLASGSADCSGCHDLGLDPHPGTVEAHAFPAVDCGTGTGCHADADVAALHKGDCSACHTPGRTLTTNCSGCHPAQPHPDFTVDHTAAPFGCTTAGCHETSVITIHTKTGGPGCAACHGVGKPALTTQCASSGCHPDALGSHAAHPVAPAAEPISIGGVSYGTRACSDCHTPLDLIGLHAGRCAACHGGPSASATISGGCAQAGCHATGTLAKHAGIETAHTLGAAPSCVAFACHSGGTNIAALHAVALGAGATAPGCAACHAPGVTPTTVCGTAGCHSASDPNPVVNGHPKMTAGHTTGLPASCVKAGCHASDLTALHASAGGCTICHRTGKTLTKDCATSGCHVAEVSSTQLHPTYVTGHVTAAGGCATTGCHSTDVISLHIAGENAPGCAACHAAGKTRTLVCTTGGCHATLPAEHSSHPVNPVSAPIVIGGASFGTHACSECHTPLELIQLHGGRCASCHASAPTATFTGGCAQGSCHTTGALAMHADATSAHTLAGAPSCTGSAGCHAGGTNLAALHASTIAGAAAPGCAVCHAKGAKLTATCSTQGCHSASDRHPLASPHPAITAGHTGSLSATCVSAGCHGADLASLHAGANACATCHGAGKTPSKDCSKSGCHPYAVDSTTLHPTYVTAHTAAASGCTRTGCHATNAITLHTVGSDAPGCKACHASGKPKLTLACETAGCHATAQAGHDSHPVAPANETLTISGVSFGSHACSECHAPLDLLDLHNGNCAACHTATGVSATFAGGCAQGGCHTSGALLKHGTIDADHVANTASCTSGAGCHAGGTNVAAVHKVEGCATCHAAGKSPTAVCSTSGCHGAGSSHPLPAPHPDMAASHTTGLPSSCVKSGCHGADLAALHAAKSGCATCHWNGKVATKECGTAGCHATGLSSMHSSHPATVAPASIKINGLSLGTYACTTCHASMDLQAIHGGAGGCAKCHPGAAKAVGTWDGGCSQPACHGATSPRPMHADVNVDHTLATQPGCTKQATGCHQGNSNVGGRDFALMHFPTAKKCLICHSAGSTKPADCAACHEQWATGDHQSDHAGCNACHAPFKWDPLKAVMGTGDPSGNPVAFHWNLSDAAWTVKIGRAVIRQGYPYGDFTQLREPGVLGRPGPYTTSAERTVTYDCTACHEGPGKTWVHPSYNNFLCGNTGDCHEHHWLWDPAQGSESYVHNTPPASWLVPSMRW